MKSEWIFSALALAMAVAGCGRKEFAAVEAQPMAVSITRIAPDTPMKEVLRVQGSLRAKNSAAISARVPGAIDGVKVDEGSLVKEGTILFTIDQENLSNAVRAAADDLSIARTRRIEAEAALEKATKDRDRMNRLRERNAVTVDAAERAELQYKVANASLAAVDALITKSESGLAVARKNLMDSVVKAPFDGIITRKLKDAGDYAGPGTPVFYMENASSYEVTCQLNSDCYAMIEIGQTRLAAKNPDSLAGSTFPITYKAASVNGKSRTFEVRAKVPKSEDMITGMIIDVEIVTRDFSAATLPVSALAYRGGKWVVFAIENGKTVSRDVMRGVEWTNRVEIVNAEELKDADIVESGILLLNEGDAVRMK